MSLDFGAEIPVFSDSEKSGVSQRIFRLGFKTPPREKPSFGTGMLYTTNHLQISCSLSGQFSALDFCASDALGNSLEIEDPKA